MELKEIISEMLADSGALAKAGALGHTSESAKDKLLVALSGGSDSTSLLVCLNEIAGEKGLSVVACHVNHRLRGAESDEDEQFCRRLCGTLKIPLDVRQCEHASEYEIDKSEESLRDLRYDLLLGAARKAEARYLLTAHTLDDQIETLLFRLWRGTSLKGLTGMSLCRPLAADVLLVRPMLSITKNECRRFLIEHGMSAREDSSNLDEQYTRNYVRNAIVPAIESRFGDFKQRMEQLRQIVAAEEELLAGLTTEMLAALESKHSDPNCWDLQIIEGQPLAIKRRLVAEALRQRSIEVTFERVETILELIANSAQKSAPPGKKWALAQTLSSSWQICLKKNQLVWLNTDDAPATPLSPLPVKIPGNTIHLLLGRVLSIETLVAEPGAARKWQFPPADAEEALVNLAPTSGALVLRSPEAGDIIQPFGMATKVRLKKYLKTHKQVESNQLLRPLQIVLADQEEVLWVPGVGISDKIKVTDKPSHRLKWLPLDKDEVSLA